MGVLDVLAIVFIVLKLVGVITWSWWWVLSPIWGAIVFTLLLVIKDVTDDWWSDSYF